MRILKMLPAWDWLKDYNNKSFADDAMAAVIVTIMLIPQSLAYALLAGLPAQVGLYASIFPLLGYALFGSSRVLAVGPVAVVSLLTASSIGAIAEAGSIAYLEAAIALALLSGIFMFALGLLRAGFVANFLSHSVISGFITASGILIATSQLKHLLGVSAHGHSLPELVTSLIDSASQFSVWTLLIGVCATAFLFWVRGNLKALLIQRGMGARLADVVSKAGPVAAIVVSILLVRLLALDTQGVSIVGEIPQGLPPIAFPEVNWALWQALLPAAIVISIIGFVESVSVAQTLAAKRRQSIEPNRELLGLGAANVASALGGGYPVTGGFARSVVNFDAGARTPMAGVLTAVGILLATLLLTPLFYYLPKAVLAATIIVAVVSLIDIATIKHTWRYSKADFSAMLATILVVLLFGVEAGVIIGVSVSILVLLWQTSRPHIAVVGQVGDSEHFRNYLRHDVTQLETALMVRIDERLYFANTRNLEQRLLQMVSEHAKLKDVVLVCTAVNDIDSSAVESLERLNELLASMGVNLHLAEVKGPVMDKLQRSHLLAALTGQVHLSLYQVFQQLKQQESRQAITN